MSAKRGSRTADSWLDAVLKTAPGCAAFAAVGFALSFVFFWSVGDTLGITEENAVRTVFRLESAELEAYGRKRDRFEWVLLSSDGEKYVLDEGWCGGRFDEIVAAVRAGDALSAKTDRGRNILELHREGEVLLPWETGMRGAWIDMAGFAALSVFMGAAGAAMAVRAVRLIIRRKAARSATGVS